MNRLLFLTILIQLISCSPRSVDSSPNLNLTILQPDNMNQALKELNDLHIDIAGVDLENNRIAIVDPGFSPLPISTKFSIPISIPEKKYLTPSKMVEELEYYSIRYSDIAQLKQIGSSLQGRPIYAIKITSNVSERQKPVVVFNAMHHARELMTAEVGIDIVDYLLTNYSSDSQVKNWVDNTIIWVIPMVNVDGNAKVWTDAPLWRKNTRDNYGVDLNRNYPFAWNSCNGSSSEKFAQTYRGPSPNSEPETVAMMEFIKDIKPNLAISFHSFSEIVIYPFGCAPLKANNSNTKLFADTLASKLERDSGNGTYKTGTAWELLYNADGTDTDWLHSQGILAVTVEVNSMDVGFQPLYSEWRDKTVKKVRAGWQYALDFSIEHFAK